MNKFNSSVNEFLAGKSDHTLDLFNHFIAEFETLGTITVEATKTMIAIDNGVKRVAWVTQLGKNFVHVVFPFQEPFHDNLCFQKIAQVPGSNQFNHHFRMLEKEDVNQELKSFMKLTLTN